MNRTAILIVAIVSIPSCRAASPFISRQAARASDLADAIASSAVAFESSRAEILNDPPVCEAFASELVRRILALEAARRAAESGADPVEQEKISQRIARYRATLPELGESGARVFVSVAAGAGPEVGIALGALERMTNDATERPISDALGDPDPRVRRGALRAIATTPARISAQIATLLAVLNDGDWTLRREAAAVLGRGGDALETINSALAERLGDQNIVVAQEAARALGERRAVSEVSRIIDFLDRTKAAADPLAGEAAVLALRNITNRRDLVPDPAVWRRWVADNQAAPAAPPNK